MITEEFVTDLWVESLQDAYRLAFGERMGELRDKRAKRFDDRGLHPYTMAWARVWAYEACVPWLAIVRVSSGPEPCDPVSMRRTATRDASMAFAREVRERGEELFT